MAIGGDAKSRTEGAATATSAGRPPPDIGKALAWMGVAILAFTLTAVAGRECGRSMSAMNMVFWRNGITLAILLVAFRIYGVTLADLATKQPGLQWGRAMMHFCGQLAWMTALLMIPLLQLVALEFTTPLWIAILAPFLLGEKLTPARVAAAVLGFIGAMIIIRPGSTSLSYGSVLALACAVFFSLNLIGTRYLTRRDSALTIMMFMAVNHTILAGVLSLGTIEWPSAAVWPWVLTLGVVSLVAHFALARALAFADAVVIAPWDYLRLPLMAIVGVMMYGEPLQAIVILGTLVVISGNAVNLWGERAARLAKAG